MKKTAIERIAQKGSLMIEAMAMLGLIAMVTPMVYKKAAERTTELQDINEAGHIRIISRALDDYLKDNYTTIDKKAFLTVAETNTLKNYFPQGFAIDSRVFRDIKFYVDTNKAGGKKVLTGFMIAEPREEKMPLLRASRIASMIGTNGGYVDTGDTVKGTQGIWSMPKSTFGSNLKSGTIVATSMQSIADSAGGVDLLYRVDKGSPMLNTMKTTLRMEANTITGTGNLIMGSANISGEVKGGSADIGGNIKAGGSATIIGSLKAGASNLASAVVNTTLAVTGDTTLTGKLTGKNDVILEKTLAVTGDTTLTGKLTGKEDVLLEKKLDVKGAVNLAETVSVGKDLSVAGATTLKGKLTAEGGILTSTVEANKVIASEVDTDKLNAVTLQGGKSSLLSSDYSFVAQKGQVQVTDGNELKTPWMVTSAAKGVLMGANEAAPKVKITDTEFVATPSTKFGVTTGEFNVNNMLNVSNPHHVVVTGVIRNKDASNQVMLRVESGDGSALGRDEASVYIRKGAIQLGRSDGSSAKNMPARFDGKYSLLTADKLVTNNPYSSQIASVTRDYDAYQVNPAYTSVMHDIKLSTRGGARLSDILPDFINKGIYVLDNTYTEAGAVNWPTFDNTSNPAACSGGDFTCKTSPWLGFIPKPQCPPGYSRVATIAPLRFSMAHAYAVQSGGAGSWGNAYMPNEPKAIGDSLKFQGSTWMNMSLQANNVSSANFRGWHALMGFIYPADVYQTYADYINGSGWTQSSCSKSGSANINECVIWNLLPVYNQELAAIANVYCYFDRSQFGTNQVDTTYDQLGSIRGDFDKSATPGYTDRLNDPTLGYKEVW